HSRPETRLQALCAYERLGNLSPDLLLRALHDDHAGVRRHGVRIAGNGRYSSPEIVRAIVELVDDPDGQVRLQLACVLGTIGRPEELVELMTREPIDSYMTAAALSSLNERNIANVLFAASFHQTPPVPLLSGLITTAI